MIVTDHDIRKAERYIRLATETHKRGEFLDLSSQEFFWDNPHLLMPLAFDDYYGIDWEMADDYEKANARVIDPSSPPIDVSEEFGEHVRQTFGLAELWFSGQESLYRDLRSGAWFWFEGITDDERLHFVGSKSLPHRYIAISEWLDSLKKSLLTCRESTSRLWLPQVFSPRAQMQNNEALSTAIQPILLALKNEKKTIQDISWRSLEEIVAELLRVQGMKIQITPKSRDGGRDIIAKGEFANGESMLIAVEVKQKPVVGLADVQRALKANEDFPSLMVVTSGRFSSGVVREKQRTRHQLRLFLKDGVALSQWIDAYKI